jgi:hypothetical protein
MYGWERGRLVRMARGAKTPKLTSILPKTVVRADALNADGTSALPAR